MKPNKLAALINHIKQAFFAAEDLLNWTPDQTGHLYRSVSLIQAHYNEAATQWPTVNYPQTEAVSVAWITGKSVAEAGLLWLQELALAIESLKRHEQENGKPLNESEGFELIREALRDWYGYAPTKPEVAAMRMQFMAKLTIEEGNTLGATESTEDWEEALAALRRKPQKRALAVAIHAARFGLTWSDAILVEEAFPKESYADSADSVRTAVNDINTTWDEAKLRCYIKQDPEDPARPYKIYWRKILA